METKSPLPAVEVAERSDPGRDPEKQVNEDACGYEETALGHLAVLCDGMGGHQNGREAATLAVKTILETFSAAKATEEANAGARGRELLEQAIVAANERVFELGGTTKHGRPGSTVVAMLLHAGGAEVAHVGDSRCYMIHGTQIFQITKDHSMVQKLVDAQILTPAQAAVHPDANQILRALGSSAEVEVEVRAQTIAHVAGDAFVLCSDGLCDLVDSAEILKLATSAPPAQAAGQLIDLANARGGHDNITVMILRARESVASVREREALAPTVAQTLVAAPVFVAPALQSGSQPTSPEASSSQNVPVAASSQPVLRPTVDASPPGVLPAPPIAGLPPEAVLGPELPQPPPKRRISVAVAIGVVLAVVGIGAAGFAIYLLLNPSLNEKQVAPFARTGLPMASSRPPAQLVPVAPDPEPSSNASIDSGPPPAPLPSLVPSPRPLRHGHGW
jgi:serine/threonine protein phosphatase PrpC